MNIVHLVELENTPVNQPKLPHDFHIGSIFFLAESHIVQCACGEGRGGSALSIVYIMQCFKVHFLSFAQSHP